MNFTNVVAPDRPARATQPAESESAPPTPSGSPAARFRRVRSDTMLLCEPLTPEDCVVQSMPDCSPIRWHLAHTTWFFETFLLKEMDPNYQPVNEQFEYLFNSYYNAVGEQFPRAERGLLTRPSFDEVIEYRRVVDERLLQWLDGVHAADSSADSWLTVLEIGLQHEQQHQELMLTDIKHLFSRNPLAPAYRPGSFETGAAVDANAATADLLEWIECPTGLVPIGHEQSGFAFDNESPGHTVYLAPYSLANRLVTCGEYLEFLVAGGYQQPEHWLSLGWQHVCREGWRAPLYWTRRDDDAWWQFTLSGLRPVKFDEPVCHVSYFEAEAYARWAGFRLPTEFEWEAAAKQSLEENSAGLEAGHFADRGRYHPAPLGKSQAGLGQLWGDVWEWTSSSYAPYPGYRSPAGAIGEYNGKFMCNQYVLRGGSCATPTGHLRPTYRNFFDPATRWQFSGIRLAR